MLNKIIPWVLVGALVVLLVWSLNTDSGEPGVIEKHTTDTLIIIKTDTLVFTDVIIKETPKDTVYITSDKGEDVPIPISEYKFSEEGEFDFRVSGFNVNLLSATIYPKTITQVIETNTSITTKENKSALFVYGGFGVFSEAFYPKAGLALSLKNKWLISADISYFQKQPMIGATIGYNMLNK